MPDILRTVFIVLIAIVGVIVASAAISELTKSPLERALEDVGTEVLTDPDFFNDRIDQMQQEQDDKEQAFIESKRAFCDARGGIFGATTNWCNVEEQCLEAGGVVIEHGIYDLGRCKWFDSSLKRAQGEELQQNCNDAGGRFVRDGSYLQCTVNAGWLAPITPEAAP